MKITERSFYWQYGGTREHSQVFVSSEKLGNRVKHLGNKKADYKLERLEFCWNGLKTATL